MPHSTEPLPESEQPTARVCLPRSCSHQSPPPWVRPSLTRSNTARGSGSAAFLAVVSASAITSSSTSVQPDPAPETGRVRCATAASVEATRGAAASRSSSVCPARARIVSSSRNPLTRTRRSLGAITLWDWTRCPSRTLVTGTRPVRPQDSASCCQRRRQCHHQPNRRAGPAHSRS